MSSTVQQRETHDGSLATPVESRARRSTPWLTVVAAASLVLLIVLLDVYVYLTTGRAEHSPIGLPELAGELTGRLPLLATVLVFLGFLGGSLVAIAIERHHREQLALKLITHVENVERGDYSGQLRFRRTDRVEDVETAFNRLNLALYDKTCHEADRLERLAELAKRARSDEDLARLRLEISELAARMRRVAAGRD